MNDLFVADEGMFGHRALLPIGLLTALLISAADGILVVRRHWRVKFDSPSS